MMRILVKKEWHWEDMDMFRNLGWCMLCSMAGSTLFLSLEKNKNKSLES